MLDRTSNRGRLLLAPLLIGAGCATSSGALKPWEQDQPKIASVKFVGNRSLSDSAIGSGLATQASNRFLFFGSVKHLDPGAVDVDTKRIESVYAREGFYAARARARVSELGPDEVEVVFRIREGPPTIVRSLLIDGVDQLPDEVRARALDRAPLLEGQRFVDSDYEALKQQLLSRLLDQGYAMAKVKGRAEVSPEEGSADLILEVEPGRTYRFGDIEVEGNLLIPARKVESALRLDLHPGDLYSPQALRDAEQEVFALGVYSSAVAVGGTPDPEEGTLPVRVVVTEADFLHLRAGGGVGIEQGFEQIRGLVDFTHLNLFGGMQRLSVNNDLAYRFLIGEERSGFAARSVAELTQPEIIGARTSLALRLGYERQLTQSYTSQSVAGRIGTPIRLRRWLFFTPSYNLERFFSVDVFDESELAATEARAATPLVNCPKGCLFSFLEQRLIADRRSNPLEPTSGWYASLGLQEGGGPLGGDFSWIRLVPEARYYVPISQRFVLAARIELGYLKPLRTAAGCDESPDAYSQAVQCSPIVVRFFGGGASGFRGTGAGRLSPLRAATATRRGKEVIVFVPQGGNSSSLGSLELRWRMAPTWASAFFLDAGNVAAGPAEAFDLSQLHYALGAGIRYITPIGPARLDVGYRFLHRHLEIVNDEVQEENHLIDWFAVFVSIGEAF